MSSELLLAIIVAGLALPFILYIVLRAAFRDGAMDVVRLINKDKE